jgi:hypothetical protein
MLILSRKDVPSATIRGSVAFQESRATLCQIVSSVMHATNQRRTGHSSNAMLVAGTFTISKTKCLRRGLLKEFRGPFGLFCIECCIRSLLIPVRPCYKCLVSTTSILRNHLLSHNIEMAKIKAPAESSTPTTAKKPKTSQLTFFIRKAWENC